MSKRTINFMQSKSLYENVLDGIIDPIIKYLPGATKLEGFQEGCLNVCFFIEDQPRNVVFMSHGMGDKSWRDGHKVKDFDYVCVSGPSWKDKLIRQGVDENKILINGFTKLDPLFKDFKKHVPNDGKTNVLYAPTHTVVNQLTSYPRLVSYFDNVPDDIDLFISAHPFNNKGTFIFDLFKWADVIISDCSSIIYEAFSLGIPVAFPDWLVKDNIIKRCHESFTEKIYVENIGYHASNIDDLWKQCRKAKLNGLDNITENFIEGIFPKEFRGNSGRVTADILLKLAES